MGEKKGINIKRQPTNSRCWKLPTRLFLLFVSVLFTLVVAEGIARVFDIGPKQIPMQIGKYQLSTNKGISYQLVPGSDDGIAGTHNRWGMRSPDISKEKPEGVYRVAFIGDSITYGAGVGAEDTFANLVTELFLMEEDLAMRVETMNFGVVGYSIHDTLAVVEHQLGKFDPDLVVYTYCMNDPQRFSVEREMLLEQLGNRKSNPVVTLIQRSRLGILARTLTRGTVKTEREDVDYEAIANRDPQMTNRGWNENHYFVKLHKDPVAWAEARQALGAIVDHCREGLPGGDGEPVPLLTLLSPILYDITDDGRYALTSVEAHLTSEFADEDLLLFNLRPDFAEIERRHGDVLPVYWGELRDGLHFSSYGHRAVAAILYQAIARESGLSSPSVNPELNKTLEAYRLGNPAL